MALPLEFPFPTQVTTLVYCDVDETYIPHLDTDKTNAGVEALETFLAASTTT